MITLLVGLAQSDSKERRDEYDACLHRNISNASVGHVVIVAEENGLRTVAEWVANPKVSVFTVGKRAFYSDYLSLANRLDGVVVVTNADVQFDWSISKLNYIPARTLCAITRTDMFGNLWSSDAWAFRPVLDVKGCDWSLGRWECETAFCEQVREQLDWELWDPCYEVCLTHVHGSGVFSAEHNNNVGYKKLPRPKVVLFDRAAKKFRSVSKSGDISRIEESGGLHASWVKHRGILE